MFKSPMVSIVVKAEGVCLAYSDYSNNRVFSFSPKDDTRNHSLRSQFTSHHPDFVGYSMNSCRSTPVTLLLSLVTTAAGAFPSPAMLPARIPKLPRHSNLCRPCPFSIAYRAFKTAAKSDEYVSSQTIFFALGVQ